MKRRFLYFSPGLRFSLGLGICTLALWLLGTVQAFSQCPMCKAAVESANGNGKTLMADGLNTGIIYMFVLPYIMILGVGLLWYRGYRRKKAAQVHD